MENKFMELNDEDRHQKIYQFSYDYFFHYLLHRSEMVRLHFCRFLSSNNHIQSVEVISSEIYGGHVTSKKLVCDVVMKDDCGSYYNLEMQNYDFNKGEEIRIMQYIENLIQQQLKKGIDYKDIKDVYQLVLYTGKPYGKFQSYIHKIRKGDIERQLTFIGDVGTTTIYQLNKQEEEADVELRTSPMEQLMRLFKNNTIDEQEEMNEITKEVIKIHNEYLDDEKAQITALELERERLTMSSRLSYAKEEGEIIGIEKGKIEGKKEGKMEGQHDNVFKMFQKVYPNEDTTILEGLTLEQYDTLHDMIFDREPIDNLKKYIGID